MMVVVPSKNISNSSLFPPLDNNTEPLVVVKSLYNLNNHCAGRGLIAIKRKSTAINGLKLAILNLAST